MNELSVTGYIFHKELLLLIKHKILNLWLPVGGKIDEGETPDEAMIREAKEETNLDITLPKPYNFGLDERTISECAPPFYANVHTVKDSTRHCLFYVCETTDISPFVLEEGHKGFVWVDETQLSEYLQPLHKKQAQLAFDTYKLFKSKEQSSSMQMENMSIGSDETLKGDTFGGLVVAAVAVSESQKQQLVDLGITDSKKLTDEKILALAPKIRELCPYIAVRNIYPVEYNQHKQTELMNASHMFVAQEIKDMSDTANVTFTHIVDKYPGCTVGDIAEEKAESKYVQVAAASIIAREEGLKQLAALSEKIGFIVPKGSTHVSDALERLRKSELDPTFYVKLHFKNVQKALGR